MQLVKERKDYAISMPTHAQMLPTNIGEKFPPSGHVRKSYLVDLLIDPFKELLSNNFWTEKNPDYSSIPSGRPFSFFWHAKGILCMK